MSVSPTEIFRAAVQKNRHKTLDELVKWYGTTSGHAPHPDCADDRINLFFTEGDYGFVHMCIRPDINSHDRLVLDDNVGLTLRVLYDLGLGEDMGRELRFPDGTLMGIAATTNFMAAKELLAMAAAGLIRLNTPDAVDIAHYANRPMIADMLSKAEVNTPGIFAGEEDRASSDTDDVSDSDDMSDLPCGLDI